MTFDHFCYLCVLGFCFRVSLSYPSFSQMNTQTEIEKETEEHEMKLVIGVVLFPGLQEVNQRVNQGRFLPTNEFLIRLLTGGHAFVMLDTILGRIFE